MHDLAHFALADMADCCAALRTATASATDPATAATAAAEYLFEHLVDKERGIPACLALRVDRVAAGVAIPVVHLGAPWDPASPATAAELADGGSLATVTLVDDATPFGHAVSIATKLPEGMLVISLLSRLPIAAQTLPLLRPVGLCTALAMINAELRDERDDVADTDVRDRLSRELLASYEMTIREQGAQLDAAAHEAEVRSAELAASQYARSESHAWAAALAATWNDALFTIDTQGRVHDLNNVAERMFAWRRDEAIGRELADLIIPPPLRDLHRRGLARAAERGHSEFVGRRIEMTAQDRHGHEFPVELSVASVMRGGEMFFTGSVRDLTELKRAERAAADEARAYETLRRIGIELLAELDPDLVLHTITTEATSVIDAEFGAFVWPPSPGRAPVGYEVAARVGLADTTPSPDAVTSPLITRTFGGDGPVRIDDITRDSAVPGGVVMGAGLPWGPVPVRSFLAVPVVARSGEVLAALTFGHSRSAVFDDRDARLAAGLAAQASVVLEHARLYQATEQARHAAERAADRLARLQSLSAALSDPLEPHELADVIIMHVRDATDADQIALLLCDDAGDLVLAGDFGWNPDVIAPFQTVRTDDALPIAEALRDDRLILIGSIEERAERYPHLAGTPATVSRAFGAIPLIFERRRLGAIALGWSSPRRFDDDDRRLFDAVGSHVAQALERERLHDADRATASRQAFLARAGVLLASSLDHEATLARVARLVVPELADSCTIHLVDRDALPVVALAHRDPELDALLRELNERQDAARHSVLLEVARTGRPLLVPDVPADIIGEGASPEEAEMRARLQIRSGLAVPLIAHGQTLGVLALTMGPSGRRFSSADLDVVEELARRAALAIDNARTFAVRSEAARTLQTSLLPPSLPEVPGVELAARYRPVEDGSLVGGDFYDVFALDGGRFGLVMGDVSGKGVSAASLTALVRYTIRALSRREPSPAEVLRQLNDAVLDYGASDRYCTVAYLVVTPDAAGAGLVVARGGHPGPLRIRPPGTIETLGVPGTGIGLIDAPDISDTSHRLEVGDLVMLYTDGITDARAADGRFAGEILNDLLPRIAGISAEGAASIVERSVLDFTDGHHRDDMALLLGRVTGAAGS